MSSESERRSAEERELARHAKREDMYGTKSEHKLTKAVPKPKKKAAPKSRKKKIGFFDPYILGRKIKKKKQGKKLSRTSRIRLF